jgi:exopolysaccharide biosynthesis polyprenyl glycosylphosphotransferase
VKLPEQADPEIVSVGSPSSAGATRSSADVVDLRHAYERPAIHPIHRQRWRVLILVMAVLDLLAITGALAVALFLSPASSGTGAPALSGRQLAWVLAWWLGLAAVGLYDVRRIENVFEELRRILSGVSLGAAIAIIASYSLQIAPTRGWMVLGWIAALVFVSVERRVIRKSIHALRRRGRLRRRGLIVGADCSAIALADEVLAAPWEGLDVIGFVAAGRTVEKDLPAPLVGNAGDLRELAVALSVSDVLVAPGVAGTGDLHRIISALDGVPVELRVAPGLDGFLTSRLSVQPLGNHALLAIERNELRPLARVAKRGVDLVLGGVLLLLSAPLIGLGALAVRLDSAGPAFFSQPRVGLRGRRFRIWKLRTMREDAEDLRAVLADLNEAGHVLFKISDDPRVTRIGRFLRRTSLDELPQLANVVLGHMSLVGPRPPLPSEVERYDETIGRRLLVRPGMTGLWQVAGRNMLSFEDYVRYDVLYVQNWSLTLDLYILAKTIPAVVSGRGAY